jgi:hypothetical protein
VSFFGDLLGFESLNVKSMWDKARKNPEQLLLGAATPVGAAAWGKITGKDYQPMVNALGGPMGGGPLGTDNTGGVYDEAAKKGINTGNIAMSHDIAELVASIYGGKGAMSGLGNAFGGQAAGAGSAVGQGAAGYTPAAGDAAAMEAAGASAAANPATGNLGALAPKSGGFNWQQGMQMANGLLGQSQQPPQQMTPPPQQQTDNTRQRQLQVAMRLQELRAKPMKTPQEKAEMEALMKNPMGLL